MPVPSQKKQLLFLNEPIQKIFTTLVAIFLVYVIVLLGTIIRNNVEAHKHIGYADTPIKTIAVEGTGTVTAIPDIATISLGMVAEAGTVLEAQTKNSSVMNALLSKLSDMSIDEKDIQTTAYNVYPLYDYFEDRGQVLRGYQVSQNVVVKIRDVSKAGLVLEIAGTAGANSVSGIEFTVDERDVYIAEARTEALVAVAEKAAVLSRDLGVSFTRIQSYQEYESPGAPPIYAKYDAGGFGGAAAPDIAVGSNEISLTASVTFEIR